MSPETGIPRRTRVLVADDSPFVCRLLASYLTQGGCEVMATAAHGERALELAHQLAPDVLTLDLEMPGMDGLALLERLMSEHPLPVVVVSGVSGKSAHRTLKALELGAVDFVLKYEPHRSTDPRALELEIVAKVEAAAKIRVVRTLSGRRGEGTVVPIRTAANSTTPALPLPGTVPAAVPGGVPGGVVVIGASTGGPLALRQLLAELPADFSAAVLVVQHIPASFTPVLAAQLDRQVALRVREAREGDRPEAGAVLVAPGGQHLLLGHDGRVRLSPGLDENGHCPSIDVTMQAAAQIYGARACGVLLTGMGEDGVLGLVAIRNRGGQTFAQEPSTCAVAGMPQRAIERGAAERVAPPAELGRWLAGALAPRRRQRAC